MRGVGLGGAWDSPPAAGGHKWPLRGRQGALYPRQVGCESRQAENDLPALGVQYFYFVEPGTNNSLRKAVASGA